MLQRLNITLTVFALLVCPLRCYGGLASVSAAMQGGVKAGSVCGCKCCARNRMKSEQPGAPAPHEEGCGCVSCLCHGAVTTSKVSVPALEVCEFFVAPLALDEAPSVEMLVLAERGDPDDEARPHSGRPLRFEMQSLLN